MEELVFLGLQSGLCTAFVLTVSDYHVDIMSLTGTALLENEMCLPPAKNQKLTSNPLSAQARYKLKESGGSLHSILVGYVSDSSLPSIPFGGLNIDSIIIIILVHYTHSP